MTTPYSLPERLLHYLAFATLPAQKALADMERLFFSQRFTDIPVDKPVFITALPRAGTTLLLNVLATMPDFATHTYRDLPFVLIPMLWAQISSPFRKTSVARERAHGDGLVIDYDSPEAFEEILWKAHWPEHYQPDRLTPWTDMEDDADFWAFLQDHMRKIIALHSPLAGAAGAVRYLSKNNANIARLGTLLRVFPNGRILIPVRHPWHHAESLRRQHRQFSTLHATDAFSRRYMEWLGHHEFGAALKPIDFNGWMAGQDQADPMESAFWLRYWHAAYGSIWKTVNDHAKKDAIILIDYDRLCRTPQTTLPQLAERLELQDPKPLLTKSGQFRQAKNYEIDKEVAGTSIYKECKELYAFLLEQCLATPCAEEEGVPS